MALSQFLGKFRSMAKRKLFNERRGRGKNYFERKIGVRKSNEVVLIVCEGEKTEPNYLRGLRHSLRLSNATINILDTNHGSDPVSVVSAAISEFEKDPSLYDRVYCVFDKDSHANYAAALDLTKNHALARRKILFVSNSVPCFEIWLLLHFKYTTQAYVRKGNKSPCDCVVADLKRAAGLANYVKNHKGIYDLVSSKTKIALENAKKLEKFNLGVGSDNPSTKMHDLVAYLTAIAPD
jgi:hypothetical protein